MAEKKGKTEEAREESLEPKNSYTDLVNLALASAVRHGAGGLEANTVIASHLSNPLSEMKMLEKQWDMMFDHWLHKAEFEYKPTLPEDKQEAYQARVDGFKEKYPQLTIILRQAIYAHNLSIMGENVRNTKELASDIVNSHAGLGDTDKGL
jgi:hypothetical protein